MPLKLKGIAKMLLKNFLIYFLHIVKESESIVMAYEERICSSEVCIDTKSVT